MLAKAFVFWGMCVALLALPSCLLLLGFVAVRRRRPEARDGDEKQELRFARWLAWSCACVPVAQIAVIEVPHRMLGNAGAFLEIALPVAGIGAAGFAAILLVRYAQGLERLLGPLAAMFAAFTAALILLGGMAAA